jgi:ATP/maltotriose-dependent transcriptional regulator MalT
MNINVPSDNGSIGQALEDLDAKLAAWTKTIKEVQSEIEAKTEDDVQSTEVEQGVLEEGEAKDTTPDIPEVAAVEVAAEEVAAEEVAELEEVAEERESASTDINAELAQSCVQEESGERAEGWTDEDQELLASLDEETVAKIKVMARLTSGKTSVRELLEMSQKAEQQAKEEPSQKKSWFFGKRG